MGTTAAPPPAPTVAELYCGSCGFVFFLLSKKLDKIKKSSQPEPLCRFCSRPLKPLDQADSDPALG
jgi:hypothetical protein